jgi:5'-nucleotidase
MKKDKPLILITNDDGVKAGGINALIEAIRSFGEILVVAPDKSMSGQSHAITVKVPLYISQVFSEKGLTVYKTNGTPADCVKLAIGEILKRKPDFLLSGINHGTNSSISMHYSGTVAAAREGALNYIPSVGFSLLDYTMEADFTVSKKYCEEVFRFVLENGIKPEIFYNVNIPKGNDIKGIKICRQAKGRWVEEFDKRIDPHGRAYYWMTGNFVNDEPASRDTDEWALKNKYVSLTPCSIDGTCFEEVKTLNKLLDN